MQDKHDTLGNLHQNDLAQIATTSGALFHRDTATPPQSTVQSVIRDDYRPENPRLPPPLAFSTPSSGFDPCKPASQQGSSSSDRSSACLSNRHQRLQSFWQSFGPETTQENSDRYGDRAYAAQKILEQFRELPGCSSAAHQASLDEHRHEYPEPHQHKDLSFFQEMGAPRVLNSTRWQDQEGATRPLERAEMHFAYHGSHTGIESPPQICLHAETLPQGSIMPYDDFDSYLGFAKSLAVCANYLLVTCAPSDSRNIATDLHLDAAHCEESSGNINVARNSLDVRRVPHIFLGTANESKDVAIYILFPHLPHKGTHFFALLESQRRRFIDGILIPSLIDVLPAGATVSLPGSFDHAAATATAQTTERRGMVTDSYGSKQLFNHAIQSCYLDSLWLRMRNIAESSPGYQDFADMQIFFNAKGLKDRHRTSPKTRGLSACIENFRGYIESRFNMEHIHKDLFFVDLGRDLCPEDASGANTLLWKRCCLQSYLDWLYEDDTGGQNTIYQSALLRDAANVTTRPNRKSRLAKGGVKFVQVYGRWKMSFDAGTCFPFSRKGIDELALDPRVRESAAIAANSRQDRPAGTKVLEQSYLHSKRRANEGTRMASRPKSCRQEVRMSWALMLEVQKQADSSMPKVNMPLDRVPEACWLVQSKRWCQFLWHATNRLVATFETIRAAFKNRRIPWGVTALLTMVLRLLRHQLISSDLRRDGALWWGTRTHPASGKTWQGLGFSLTMEKYGYCWVLPIIDWKRLTFQAKYQDRILFSNRALADRYSHYAQLIRPFIESNQMIEECEGWLQRCPQRKIQDRLLEFMAHLCLRQFRKEVLDKVFTPEVRRSLNRTPDYDEVFLCVDSLEQHTGWAPYVAASNRTSHKSPAAMIQHLFGEDDGLENEEARKYVSGRGYRTDYFLARDIARQWISDGDDRWTTTFQQTLVAYHWLLPNCDLAHGSFAHSVEKRLRPELPFTQPQFWALRKRKGKPAPGDVCGWAWASFNKERGAGYQKGLPNPYPPYLCWSRSEWKQWLRKQRDS